MVSTSVGCSRRLASVLLAALLCAHLADALPAKFDALQMRWQTGNVTSRGKVSVQQQSADQSLYGAEDLDKVAYGNPGRWLVKVRPSASSEATSNACRDIMNSICVEAETNEWDDADNGNFHGHCTWRDDNECLFTFEAIRPDIDIDKLLLAYEDSIEFVERDMKMIAEQECSYNFPQTNAPWHLDRIDANSVSNVLDGSFSVPESIMGENVHIYVLDTGLLDTHNEFSGRVGEGTNVLPGSYPWMTEDDNGHGTSVSSVAAGTTFGVCKCCIVHPIKCLDANGDGSYTDVIGGLSWVRQNAVGPSIVSMSLSGPTSEAINQVIHELYVDGILTIAAAGNENVDACETSPGSSQYAVTVGASTLGEGNVDLRSSFSNYGSCVDIYAPGSSIETAHYSGDFASSTRSGTSFSAPAVTGAAALYLASYPDSSAEVQKQKVLEASVSVPTIESGARMLSLNDLDVCPADAPSQDCEVSSWSSWSPSSCPDPGSVCGKPVQKRERVILTQTSCGGASCPATSETRPCTGDYEPCPSDFPTQWFGTNDQRERPAPDLDIQGRTIRFEPAGSSSYNGCIDDHTGYSPLESFTAATRLDMGDDSYIEINLGDGTFPFLGSSRDVLYIGSNGYVTFDEGDFSYMVGETPSASGRALISADGSGRIKHSISSVQESIKRMLVSSNVEGHDDFITSSMSHWTRERLAALYQDMDPTLEGDHAVYFEAKGDRLVVTFDRVPLWGMPEETNTFQIVLYLDNSSQPGVMQIWWGGISGVYRPLIGISPGELKEDQIESDMVPDMGMCSGGDIPVVPPPPSADVVDLPPPPEPAPPPPAFDLFASF